MVAGELASEFARGGGIVWTLCHGGNIVEGCLRGNLAGIFLSPCDFWHELESLPQPSHMVRKY